MPKKTKTSKRAMSNKRDAPDQTVVFTSCRRAEARAARWLCRAIQRTFDSGARQQGHARVGEIFMAIGGHSQAEVQLRIRNPTTYIASLQVK
jgi:hypothetical protein